MGHAETSLSESTGVVCPVEPPIWQRLGEAARSNLGRLAIASLHQQADLYSVSNDVKTGYLRWSYSELKFAVDRFASNLLQLGAQRGAPLATFLPNGVEFVVACWAAHELGCPFVPLNPRTLNNQEEAAYMLKIGKAIMVIVSDAQQCHLIDAIEEEGLSFPIKISTSGDSTDISWRSFTTMLREPSREWLSQETQAPSTADQLVAVLFTSGTTARPKGVPHTNSTINAFCQNLSLSGTSRLNILCSVLPNNHAMGYFFPLHFMMHGGAVVYPSPGFDALAMVNALESENVTHAALVPTCIYALVEIIENRGRELSSSLKDVCLAGSSMTPEHIHHIFSKLRSKGASTGFGMTEGSPVWSSSKQNPDDLILGDSIIAGRVSPGACVRICAPESHVPLPRSQSGEIHQTGRSTIRSYLGLTASSEKFYQDEEGRTWFITGDQGVMHPDGRFTITGRYKDMIIRGGENIAPAAIEAVISRHCHIQGYIVGAPDPIAGEVPVLILQEAHLSVAGRVRDAVLRCLGAEYVPEHTVTLAELGYEDVPRTASNKIHKAELTARVRAFLDDEAVMSNDVAGATIKKQVLAAYHKSTGIPIQNLDVNTPTLQFADSINLMRVRNYLRKNLSQTLSTTEMKDHPTIATQIKLLQGRVGPKETIQESIRSPVHQRSPEELSVLFGGMEEARAMIRQISDLLQSKQLSWDQVSSVIPVYDYLQVLLDSQIIDSWNFAIAVTTKRSTNTDVSKALKKSLSNHPILTSFLVDNQGSAHYVTMQPHAELWNQCILQHGSVKTAADLEQLTVEFPYTHLSRVPGPLTSCVLVDVDDLNSTAIIFYLHHVIQDATSLRLFMEDFNQALANPTKELVPHVDFRIWADAYAALRMSPAATASVNFHVNRLRDLHKHKSAIYPPARIARKAITESPDGLDYAFDAPGLMALRQAHPSVTAAVVLKAAMALVNVHRTGHSHAVFCNFEAGRRQFPFLPSAIQTLTRDGLEASDVNGPVMQTICNLIEIPREETAIALLGRLQEEQDNLTEHAHAPLQRIIDGLNRDGSGSGDTIVDVHSSQFTTWVPGLLGEYDELKVEKIAIRCAAGLVVVAGLGGSAATTYMISMRWDVANYSRKETQYFVEDLESAVIWLTSTDKWQRPTSDFLKTLRDTSC